MNKVIIVGAITRDQKPMESDKGVKFSYGTITVRKPFSKGNDKYSYIPFVCFGKTSAFIIEHFPKGAGIAVKGHIDVNKKTYKMSLIVDEAYFTISSAVADGVKKGIEESVDNNDDSGFNFDDEDELKF